MWRVFLFLLCLPRPLSVHTDGLNKRKVTSGWPLIPMHCPMEELRVTGHDRIVCR